MTVSELFVEFNRPHLVGEADWRDCARYLRSYYGLQDWEIREAAIEWSTDKEAGERIAKALLSKP